MRAILFSAVCLLASFASSTPLVKYDNEYELLNDNTKGKISFKYTVDAGYVANSGYSINGDDKSVTASATAGVYSQVDLEFLINLQGIFELNLKIATVPLSFNPLSTSAQWTHPMGLVQGKEMTGLINAGYDFNLGDV
jgi:hemolysin activation/secretion protein